MQKGQKERKHLVYYKKQNFQNKAYLRRIQNSKMKFKIVNLQQVRAFYLLD